MVSSTYQWTGNTGDWNTAANWDQDQVPGNGRIAIIAAPGTYVASVDPADPSLSIGSITVNAVNATLQVDGRLTASGIITISSGTVITSGGLSAAGFVDNALLGFLGTQTFDSMPVSLGGTLQVQDNGAQSILTLGPNEVITQSGPTAIINSTHKNNETIINKGTINATVSGGSLAIVPLNFSNAGQINATNEALTIGYDDGLVGGVRGSWSNTGTIALAGSASLTFDGSVTTAGLGTITGASGVTVTGIIDNSGATLNVGTGTELGTVSLQHTGVVSGGTIVDHGNGFTYTSGTFSGVTYQGPLNIATNGGRLIIVNGLTAVGGGGTGPGTINLSEGGDAIIDFQGSQTIDNATINLNGTDSFNPLTEINVGGANSVLTLGSNLTVNSTAAGTSADIRGNSADATAVVNKGTINAAAKGGGFGITPANGFTNQGLIQISSGEFFSIQPGFGIFNNSGQVLVSGGATLQIEDNAPVTPPISNSGTITMGSGTTLDLAGYYTLPSLGTIVNQGAVTQIDGVFDGLNGTVALGSGTALNAVHLDGNIRNATIAANNSLTIIPGNASLQNDVYQGALGVTSDFTRLTINQGVTFTDASGTKSGSVSVSGQDDTLIFGNNFPANNSDGQTFDNATLSVGNATNADTIQVGFFGGTFNVGANASILSSTAGALATISISSGTKMVLNGTLSASATNGSLTITGVPSGPSATTFNNNGVMTVSNGDQLALNSAIAAGSGNGTIDIGTSGIFTVGSVSVASDQTVVFTDATGSLQLAQASSFSASVSGFRTGDAIDLTRTKADVAVWTAGKSGAPGTLSITNGGSAVATLAIIGDYTGYNFNVASGKSGAEITLAVACYAAGTRILTPDGEIEVERLQAGDRVLTVSGRAQSIRWIGHRHVDFRRHPNQRRILPIRIAAHAFGHAMPQRELLLSPDHAVFIDGVLIPIRRLLNGSTVAQVECDEITYYHVELPQHDVLLAEGMPAESYLEAGARSAFANGDDVIQLHPDFEAPGDRYAMLWETQGYAPLIVVGPLLDAARQNLAQLAA